MGSRLSGLGDSGWRLVSLLEMLTLRLIVLLLLLVLLVLWLILLLLVLLVLCLVRLLILTSVGRVGGHLGLAVFCLLSVGRGRRDDGRLAIDVATVVTVADLAITGVGHHGCGRELIDAVDTQKTRTALELEQLERHGKHPEAAHHTGADLGAPQG